MTAGSILPLPTTDGVYYMLVGAGDLYLAKSSDLLNWEIVEKPILSRTDCPDFAAGSIDPGPSPFVTKDGIVAILNATDKKNHTRVFAALFQADDPTECLATLKEPCLTAEADWERFGYLPNVVRATGLALRGDHFHLYYGGADRCIGMASAPVPKNILESISAAGQVDASDSGEESSEDEGKEKVCGV
jgi:predicted GH43/DUF377 family glycosyl hydrolase